jgi:hypothetical protein
MPEGDTPPDYKKVPVDFGEARRESYSEKEYTLMEVRHFYLLTALRLILEETEKANRRTGALTPYEAEISWIAAEAITNDHKEKSNAATRKNDGD